MTDYPITPPPELLKQWEDDWFDERENVDVLLLQAFQAGADQELEACCEVLARELICDGKHVATDLRMIRRPKPPSLKKDALAALHGIDDQGPTPEQVVAIRRALEALPE